MRVEPSNLWARRVVWMLLAGAAIAPVVLCGTGCRRQTPPPAQASANGGPASAPMLAETDPYEGPLDTLRRVHQYRRAGQMTAIAAYIVPQQRDAVIEHILSVDELTSAAESLKARVNRVIGAGTAGAFDRTAIANSLGPFARDLEYISETITGDSAVVRLRVGGRLPLENVDLVRRGDRWLIQTDPPIPGLSAELRKLARVLNRVADEVEHRRLSAEQIEQELILRQRPVLERIDQLVHATQAEGT